MALIPIGQRHHFAKSYSWQWRHFLILLAQNQSGNVSHFGCPIWGPTRSYDLGYPLMFRSYNLMMPIPTELWYQIIKQTKKINWWKLTQTNKIWVAAPATTCKSMRLKKIEKNWATEQATGSKYMQLKLSWNKKQTNWFWTQDWTLTNIVPNLILFIFSGFW